MRKMRAYMKPLKKGMIISWYGTWGDIPKGWAACDGTNGTPDLRTRFIRGAGNGVSVGETGGSLSHNHNLNGTHTHSITSGSDIAAGANYSNTTSNPPKDTASQSTTTLPVYHGLWYIMKL